MAPPNSASEHAAEIAKHRRVIEIFPYTGPKIDPSTFPKGRIPNHNSTLVFPVPGGIAEIHNERTDALQSDHYTAQPHGHATEG